jgi:hypothetical protein
MQRQEKETACLPSAAIIGSKRTGREKDPEAVLAASDDHLAPATIECLTTAPLLGSDRFTKVFGCAEARFCFFFRYRPDIFITE